MLLFKRLLIIACGCIALCVPTAGRSIGLPPLPQPPTLPKLPSINIPDVSALLNGEAITTSLSDAVTGIPFLNDYVPGLARNLTSLPHNSRGEFDLVSGSYWYNGRSYCLHAGKHAPTSGSSYLYAPLKGPRAPIIEDILRNSASHLEITQPTVQQIIWAILARARVSDMQPDLQAAAAKLLSPAELLELNTNAVAFVPADKFNAVLSKVPDPLKPVLDAENSLRGMLTSNATYQDMERVAVLPSLPEPGSQTQALAQVRWSYDPHGFFLWFIPYGYSWTTTYLDVPGAVTDRTDQLGRVTTLQDTKGDSLAVTYAGPGLAVDGDSQTQFYHIASLRFIWQDGDVHKPTHHDETWSADQLVMVGVPNGNGKISAAGAQAQYDAASGLRSQFSGLLRQIHGQDNALSELMALAEFRSALKAVATAKSSRTEAGQLATTFPVNAWESALARSTGGRVAADVRAGVDAPFNPSNNTGVPQNSGAQRLAQSPNPAGGGSRQGSGSNGGAAGQGGKPPGNGKPPGPQNQPPGQGSPPGPGSPQGSGSPWQQLIQQGLQGAGWPTSGPNGINYSVVTAGNNAADLTWEYNGSTYQIDGHTYPIYGPNGFVEGWATTVGLNQGSNLTGDGHGVGGNPASSITDALQQLRGCCPAP